ncbi:enoyl-CoA hydratase/isomerase family protein [Bordetella petrii]|uniref:enoyl-CoA hydratase/isomerase family protein n=1 Tax=Bordetella petrii TaxID=94624 RepID=UPI001E36B3A1|nr:enoyl-CoA hydratase/isomerase family protein [Bordetella petrii]MCD0503022.1 enoyl-CoA hydratase/isomerase family protein [Bordetella petrii]
MESTLTLRASQLCVRGGVAEFTHQRPESRNPLSMELRHDYQEMLDAVEQDRGIKVLLITGSGGSFCAGGNIKEMQARLQAGDASARAPDATRARLAEANAWLRRLRELDAVVVAAVDGAAFGGGFSLALHADFILASARASFCMSFARLGLTPDFGSIHLLPRLVGIAAARDLMLTGRSLDAQEALRMGLVREVLDPQALLPRARAMAAALGKASGTAMGMTKQLLNQSLESDYASLGSAEAYAQAVAMSTDYHQQAVAAFLAKQPALYDWERDGSGQPAPWSGRRHRERINRTQRGRQ